MIKINKNFYKIILLVTLIILIIFGIFYFSPKSVSYGDKIKINNVEFFVEVVDDNLKRQVGLGKRDNLCENCGMLFIFDKVGRHGFWMKDMKFDIDILWIRDSEIVFIEKNVSYETPETIYNPNVESNSVLELDSGVVEEFGIEAGDRIEF
ncbi:MAG: DUF192 domain-containing protein [Candidatus Moranbacteria bacterium]|nr:DUF192 domain-containing protein [Candidatus Moranbacteria bacterium]